MLDRAPARPLARPRASASTATWLVAVVLLGVAVGLAAAPRAAALTVVAVVCAAAVVAAVVTTAARGAAPSARHARPVTRSWTVVALQLAPVVLLTAAFPLAIARMGPATVGGVPLPTVLLAAALTVPWLSMAVCAPLYRAVAPWLDAGDVPGARRRFAALWPATFAMTLPVTLLATSVVLAVLRWPAATVATYAALCVLHTLLAQSLVLANATGGRVAWAAAWVVYAGALLAAPTWWWLPAALAALTQLVPLGSGLRELTVRARPDLRDLATDVLAGLATGSVLWSHLLVLFLVAAGQVPVLALFAGALPAIVAYNVFFAVLAPGLDRDVAGFRAAMSARSLADTRVRAVGLRGAVLAAMARTAAVAAALAVLATVIARLLGLPADLVVAVAVASWLAMLSAVALYALEYMGRRQEACVGAVLHLSLVVTVLVALPPSASAYWWLAAVQAPLLVALLARSAVHWGASAYSLFWRHATGW